MQDIIAKTIQFVKESLVDAESGHDWFHIERVYKTALTINQTEKANELIVSLAALLHDIADSKFHDGNEELGPQKAENFLKQIGVEPLVIAEVKQIIRNLSFKTSLEQSSYHSKVLAVVQDADRLDAIGAIGIARTFNYGGYKNRSIYNPEIPPIQNISKEAYKNSTAPTINHFYEKLLLLKDRMNTPTGKKMAQQRHEFMLNYLEQFYAEWEGKR